MKTLNFTNRLRLIFLLIILIGLGYSATAQEPKYKIVGDEVVKIETAKKTAEPVKTELTHTIKGVKFPVYKSSRGSYFIIRTSKKTNKEYKQYLKIDNT